MVSGRAILAALVAASLCACAASQAPDDAAVCGAFSVVRVEVNTDFTGTIPLSLGQRVLVKGDYEYYSRGGVIHWTHRDPRGRHENGYVDVNGTKYY